MVAKCRRGGRGGAVWGAEEQDVHLLVGAHDPLHSVRSSIEEVSGSGEGLRSLAH